MAARVALFTALLLALTLNISAQPEIVATTQENTGTPGEEDLEGQLYTKMTTIRKPDGCDEIDRIKADSLMQFHYQVTIHESSKIGKSGTITDSTIERAEPYVTRFQGPGYQAIGEIISGLCVGTAIEFVLGPDDTLLTLEALHALRVPYGATIALEVHLLRIMDANRKDEL
mmetsp:Transcript_31888/g.44619  ORF Transcript_31888/g.44619 Transcript_31888/m.44619 type:complete len:172 (+) Transcript_31888:42-557(+)